MKKILLLAAIGIILISASIPQFFYYNETRKAIAIRDDQQGNVIIKNYSGQIVMTATYPANSSRWISVYKLAPGQYTAMTNSGNTIGFYRRP